MKDLVPVSEGVEGETVLSHSPDGPEARQSFLAKVRARRQDGPFFVDYGGGFGGCTVVTGPTLRAGFILQSGDDKGDNILDAPSPESVR